MSDITVTMIANPDAPAGAAPILSDADADDPRILVTDLGINRGDGIFEVAGCLDGRVQALDAHLARFARSAAALDLPAPNPDCYRAAVHHAVDALTAHFPGRELSVKFVYTRGQEIGQAPLQPVGWAMAYPTIDHTAERTEGLAVVTLDRGVASDAMARAPWLLLGAKTLSYAVNRSVVREAHRRGADDVLFVSSDGHALEGPSSSLIAVLDGAWVTPPASEGILAGTTQADLYAWAEPVGIRTEVRPILASELLDAAGAWLTSSSRLAAPIRTLDGRRLPVDAALTARMNDFLLGRGASDRR